MENYLLFVLLPNIADFFGVLCIIGFIISLIGFLDYSVRMSSAYHTEDKNEASQYGKKIIKIFISSIILLFIACFIPCRKEIVQLKAISMVSELKGIDKIPQKLLNKLDKLLDEK
jgi:hypothetical protein